MKFPKLWERMSNLFDETVTEHYERNFGTDNCLRSNVIRTYKDVLTLWIQNEDLAHIQERIKADLDPEVAPLQRALSAGQIGKILFHDCGLRLDHLLFQKRVDDYIDNLVHNDFNPEEIKSFMHITEAEVKDLAQRGHKDFKAKES